jgi:uroporphyrinogen-III decarboxylase
MQESGADIIDLDWMVGWSAAADEVGDEVSLLGNFDPVSVMMMGTPKDVYNATIKCAVQGGDRCFPAAGCEVPSATPHENLRAYAQALRDLAS